MPRSGLVKPSWRSSTTFILAVVVIGQTSDLSIYGITLPILPFVLRDRLHYEPEKIQYRVSVLLATFSLANLLFALPAGWITDWTVTRRPPYLAGLVVLIAATMLFMLSEKFWLLLISRILQGMSAAIVNAAGLAMVVDTVGSNNLGKTLGSIRSFVTIGELGAPPLGGFLYALTGIYGVLGACVALIVVDLIMRVLVVEKKFALNGGLSKLNEPVLDQSETDHEALLGDSDGIFASSGHAPLLGPVDPAKVGAATGLAGHFPILVCFSSPRLLAALFLAFVQALILGSYDATLPIEVSEEFGFSSLQAGAMFLPALIPGLFVAPLAGAAVDKYGTRFVAVSGYILCALCLALLRVPAMDLVSRERNILLFCGILVLNGICLAIIATPGVVESQNVVESFVKKSPEVFGPSGPYGQLFGWTGLVFNTGLTVGPLLAGSLRNAFGYGNMYAVMAGIAALAAVVAFSFMGERDSQAEQA